MIIRGAENISPLAIENILSKRPSLATLNILVVAAPDAIAGEVPIAVTKKQVDADTVREIQNMVLQEMGTIYVPDEVISIQALGLQAFPQTMSGKVKKTKLAELVRKYREERDEKESKGHDFGLEQTVKEIWARAVGLRSDQLATDAHISEFADSITIMRVRDQIRRQTGKSLTLIDMTNAATLGAQIKLLKAQPVRNEPPKRKERHQRPGPPSIEDMAHLTEDPDLFDVTKTMILNDLTPYGLGWEDVDEVMPAYDFATVMATTRAMDSWNFKMAFLPHNVDEKVGQHKGPNLGKADTMRRNCEKRWR
jgi:aryl carrier-like protein